MISMNNKAWINNLVNLTYISIVGGPAFFYEEPRDAEMKEPDVKNIAYT